MAQWQIFKGVTASGAPVQIGGQYDDGLLLEPHEAGFSTAAVEAERTKRGGDSWAYMGRSTQLSPKMEEALQPIVAAILGDPGNEIVNHADARALALREHGIAG